MSNEKARSAPREAVPETQAVVLHTDVWVEAEARVALAGAAVTLPRAEADRLVSINAAVAA